MKRIPKLVLVLTVAFVAFSCASAPEPTPEPPAPPVAAVPAPPTVPRPDAERARAQELRSTILDYELASFAPQDFQAAEALFAAAEAAYDRDNAVAKRSYDEAIARYTVVIEQGVTTVVQRKRAEVQQARQQADSIRSRVTQASSYDRAVTDAAAAESHLTAERYLEAVSSFDQARDGFLASYRAANETRERARRAIESADSALTGAEQEIGELESGLQAEGQ